jgi:hypothetical protein
MSCPRAEARGALYLEIGKLKRKQQRSPKEVTEEDIQQMVVFCKQLKKTHKRVIDCPQQHRQVLLVKCGLRMKACI